MRASASFAVEVGRDPAWTGFVILLLLTSSVGCIAWVVAGAELSTWPVRAGTMGALLCLLCALPAAASKAVRMRWDGARWTVCSVPGGQETTGRLQVMLDLSVVMLLRFDADAHAGDTPVFSRLPPCWIALRRSRLPAVWPALRRAVYSAPPRPGGYQSGNGPHTETTRPD